MEEGSNNKQPTHEELYGGLSVEDLIKEGKSLMSKSDVLSIKESMDYIQKRVINELDEEKNERMRVFVEDGGNELDFEYHQPQRDAFYDVFNHYKRARKERKNAITQEQEDNLKRKQYIIDEIKKLAQAEESLDETFPAFRQLQDAWKEIGNVPRSEMNELYRNYHFYVEAFYDYLQINRELRDLDFKKNKQAKEQLIEKAEVLVDKENILDAMRSLQRLHKDWKEIGPVDRELREVLWDRFSEATRAIHVRRDAFEEELKAQAEERITLKKNICELLESIDLNKINSHKQWQKTLKALDDANDKYKHVGFAKHPENDAVWERFRAVNRLFHSAKNAFYKDMKKGQQKNLESKRVLIEKANKIKDSEDWKNTANDLKAIQHSWKKIGPVPRKDSDSIWDEFRSACDHFFNRMKAHYEQLDADLNKHLEAKSELINTFKAEESIDRDGLMNYLKKWKEIGQVPRDKRSVEFEWNDLIDVAFTKIDMDKMQSSIIRYRAKIEGMIQNDESAHNKESRFLRQKMDEAKRELSQLEENMQRVSGDKDSPFMKEARKNIRHREEQIALLKEKLSVLRELKP